MAGAPVARRDRSGRPGAAPTSPTARPPQVCVFHLTSTADREQPLYKIKAPLLNYEEEWHRYGEFGEEA